MKTSESRRRLAQIILWAGLFALAAGIVLGILSIQPAAGVLVGIGLLAAGSNIVIGRELALGGEPRAFTVRGPVVRGSVEVRSGLSSCAIAACGNDRIADIRFGPFGEPVFEVADGFATLRLTNTFSDANIANWSADIAGNVLWDIDAKSTLGDLVLDLNGLRLDQIRARTGFGHLTIIAPQRGYLKLDLRTRLGRIDLQIPPEMGVKLSGKFGALADVKLLNERIARRGPGLYMTTDFESAPAQMEIRIETGAGEVFVR